MEASGIIDQLKCKSILITGSTGFLGKIFVEKVLRVQPQVKKLYLLVRATGTETAMQRVQREIIGTELFNILREKHGQEFHSFIAKKVYPVAGDIADGNLGIEDIDLREELLKKIDIVVNIAATTNFFERYDVALGINTLGAKHVLDFARKCAKLEVLLHISTAFVAGMQKGIISEKLFHVEETIKEEVALDIEAELRLVKQRKSELHSADIEKITMKELGLERARRFGWANTYVFTKAMGEMLLEHSRGDLPVVILRPTIITSIYKEPLPSWIEGTRTVDAFIEAYAKGKLACLFGDFSLIADLIPGDLVVNAMIVSMISHLKLQSISVYQICSSVRNPITYDTLLEYVYDYFDKNPGKGKDGKTIKRKRLYVIKSRPLFWGYITLRYTLPKVVLHWINVILYQSLSRQYQEVNHKSMVATRLFHLYAPYIFSEWRFDDTNMDKLRIAIEKNTDEAMIFNFDAQYIDWKDYINIHLQGLMKSMSEQDE